MKLVLSLFCISVFIQTASAKAENIYPMSYEEALPRINHWMLTHVEEVKASKPLKRIESDIVKLENEYHGTEDRIAALSAQCERIENPLSPEKARCFARLTEEKQKERQLAADWRALNKKYSMESDRLMGSQTKTIARMRSDLLALIHFHFMHYYQFTFNVGIRQNLFSMTDAAEIEKHTEVFLSQMSFDGKSNTVSLQMVFSWKGSGYKRSITTRFSIPKDYFEIKMLLSKEDTFRSVRDYLADAIRSGEIK